MSPAFWASYVVLWVLVVVESLLIFALLREIGRLHLSSRESVLRDGLKVGTTLPSIVARQRDGDEVQLTSSLSSLYTLLICSIPNCPHCVSAAAVATRWVEANPGRLGAIVLLGWPSTVEVDLAEYDPDEFDEIELLVINADTALEELEVRVGPFVYLVDRDGLIVAKGLMTTDAELEELLLAAHLNANPPRGGEIADPDVVMRSTAGRR